MWIGEIAEGGQAWDGRYWCMAERSRGGRADGKLTKLNDKMRRQTYTAQRRADRQQPAVRPKPHSLSFSVYRSQEAVLIVVEPTIFNRHVASDIRRMCFTLNSSTV